LKTIFVSYSHQDNVFAKKLVSWLEGQGHTVWMDKNKILPGANYVSSIAEGIGNADAFLPLLSPDSVKSKWVAKEIMYALESDKDIIPVLVQFAEIPEHIKFAITGIHHVDFERTEDLDPWDELDKALQSHDGSLEHSSEGTETTLAKDQLYKYVKSQQRKLAPAIWGFCAVFLVGFFVLYFGMGQGNEKSKVSDMLAANVVVVSSGSDEVAKVLKLVFTQKIDGQTPSAALGIMVQKGGGSAPWKNLDDGDTLDSLDNYRIVVQTETPSFLYVFQIDSSGKLDWLFPENSSSQYSSGNNPVKSGIWQQLPSEKEAFRLDDNIGIEHIYTVVTTIRWVELEQFLQKASKAKPVKISAPLGLKTRGVGGARVVNLPPDITPDSSKDIQSILTGKDGVLIKERWFYHSKSKVDNLSI